MQGTWQPIDSALRSMNKVDLWAKCWNPKDDQFTYRRFPDCWWNSNQSYWVGLDKEWCPTHWMSCPLSPTEKDKTPRYRVWIRENRDWAKASGVYTLTNDIKTLGPPEDQSSWLEFVEVRK